MEKKDIFLIIMAFLGWTWGIIQYLINRRQQKRDKLNDRRYEAYSTYMKKADELMNNVRTDSNIIIGIYADFMQIVITGDETQINNALIQFKDKLLDFIKKTTNPLFILTQEINSLLLICSDELSVMIDEFIYLTTDFNNEMQKNLSLFSQDDSTSMIRQLETLGHNERWKRFESLNKEITKQMRKELDYK